MNKVVVLAAALALTPLPAFAQQSEQPAANAASTQAGATGEETRKGGRGAIGNALDELTRTQLRERLAAGVDRVREACAEDIAELCGDVEPGGGRIAACVRENADELSRRCRFTLFRVARNIRDAVTNIANECEGAIRAQCASAQRIGECAEAKSAAVSPACHTLVTALLSVGQRISDLRGMAVYSSDDRDVGQVVGVQRAPDGKIQSVQIQIGR